MLADLFQLPHHVVGKISDGPGGERRQPRHRRRLMLAQQQLHELEDISFVPFAPPSAFNFDGVEPRARSRM